MVSNVRMQSSHDDCSHKGEMHIVGQVGVPMYPWIRIKIRRWNRRKPWRWCRGEKQLPMSARHWTGTFECSWFQFCFGGTHIHTKYGLYVQVHTKVALKALVPSDTYHHTYAPDKPGSQMLLCISALYSLEILVWLPISLMLSFQFYFALQHAWSSLERPSEPFVGVLQFLDHTMFERFKGPWICM